MYVNKFYIILFFLIYSNLSFSQIIATDFESQPFGTAYTRPIWQSDGFKTGNWDNALLKRTVIDTLYSVSGDKSLRLEYPKGQFGTSTISGTGAQVELLLTAANEYYMSYFFRFSENFSWGTSSEGGKLPGLTGRETCGADFMCDGTDGFSARFMWRRNGKGVLYLYHMDMPKKYGQDFDFVYRNGETVHFKKGKWYHIAERVKMNTNGSTKDGIVQVWINGEMVLSLDTIRFQSNGDQIGKFYMSSFHGGNDSTWAPTDTCHLWFDDIKISKNYIDIDYISCSNPDASYFGEKCTTKNTIEIEIKNKAVVFPNPNTGKFKYWIDSIPKNNLTLKLIHTTGQLIEERYIHSIDINQTEQFDVSHLSKGIYHLVITSDNIYRNEKIVVQLWIEKGKGLFNNNPQLKPSTNIKM